MWLRILFVAIFIVTGLPSPMTREAGPMNDHKATQTIGRPQKDSRETAEANSAIRPSARYAFDATSAVSRYRTRDSDS